MEKIFIILLGILLIAIGIRVIKKRKIKTADPYILNTDWEIEGAVAVIVGVLVVITGLILLIWLFFNW